MSIHDVVHADAMGAYEAEPIVTHDPYLAPSDITMADEGVISSSTQQYLTAEDAYRVYSSMENRSLRKTATMMGIPLGTVLSWNRRHAWRQRLTEQDSEVTEGVVGSIAMVIVARTLKNLQVLASIIDDDRVDAQGRPMATNKDKISAAQVFNQLYMRQMDRGLIAALGAANEDALEETTMIEMVQTPEGARALLHRLRERTGHA